MRQAKRAIKYQDTTQGEREREWRHFMVHNFSFHIGRQRINHSGRVLAEKPAAMAETQLYYYEKNKVGVVKRTQGRQATEQKRHTQHRQPSNVFQIQREKKRASESADMSRRPHLRQLHLDNQ